MSRVLPALAAVAVLTTLSACAEESGSPAATDTPEATVDQTEEPSEPAESEEPAAPAGDVEFTPQGTALAFGEKAVVPFKASGEQGALGVTVTAIEAGAAADLAPLDLGTQVEGMVPFYVRITVSNESGGDFSFTSIPSIDGLLADGSEAGGVFSVPSSFTPCVKGEGGEDFTSAGTTYETCTLALAPASAKVTGAAYGDDSHTDVAAGATVDYDSEPIMWK